MTNELLRQMGTEQMRLHPRFIFGDGLLKRIEYWQPSADVMAHQKRLGAFRQWTMQERSDQLPALIDENGRMIVSEESNEAMVKLAEEWAAAGKPGL